jgi:SPP1 family phage portal protein
MKYKLFGLEQLIRIKERWMKEGLRQRMLLYSNALRMSGFNAIDVNRVNIIFKRGLPVNELETAQMVSILHGIVPDVILLGQLPFVDDPSIAVGMMVQERKETDGIEDDSEVEKRWNSSVGDRTAAKHF